MHCICTQKTENEDIKPQGLPTPIPSSSKAPPPKSFTVVPYNATKWRQNTQIHEVMRGFSHSKQCITCLFLSLSLWIPNVLSFFIRHRVSSSLLWFSSLIGLFLGGSGKRRKGSMFVSELSSVPIVVFTSANH